ncbi:SDR family NAD(P)-dependent oxidoreductase [Anianabacter salinae]|uniref:SDR family NAD(P)-dependent oxidoreductase n=1 Tax=Anianabacter salinae TaxID=2851023 RepID=UPI00225E3099|nr:SDR family oxidoreductase [Anianabacter salinae]MBV0914182.1 SDR family oxidoreductase [Anianabacter salinae]
MAGTVAITGASRGLGRDLAVAFAAAGWSVFVGARTESGIQNAAHGICFVAMDVREEQEHHKLAAQAIEETGRLDCYINNAGVSAWRPIERIDEDFLDEMLAVNLKGAFWGCKAAAARLSASGTILNISSLAAKRGTINNSAYCAAKFGITGLTQSMCKELGPRGIRVNALCPVLVRTPGLMSALAENDAPAAGDPDTFLDQFRQTQTALGRLPEGNEVAALALFLTSPAASAITGQSINVDCGVLPQ